MEKDKIISQIKCSKISNEDLLFWKRILENVPTDFVSYISDFIKIYPDSILELTEKLKKQEEFVVKGDVENLLKDLDKKAL